MKKLFLRTFCLMLLTALMLSGCQGFEKSGDAGSKKSEKNDLDKNVDANAERLANLEGNLNLALYVKNNQLLLSNLESNEPDMLSASLMSSSSNNELHDAFYWIIEKCIIRLIPEKNMIIYPENCSGEDEKNIVFDLSAYNFNTKQKYTVVSGIKKYKYEPLGHQIFYIKDEKYTSMYGGTISSQALHKYDFTKSTRLCLTTSDIMTFDGSKSILYQDNEERKWVLLDENNKKTTILEGFNSTLFEGGIKRTYYSQDSNIVYFSQNNIMYKYTVGGKAVSIGEHPAGDCLGGTRNGEFYF